MALVHMDIKPDNIFISSIPKSPVKNCNASMEAILEDPAERQFVYKIGMKWREGGKKWGGEEGKRVHAGVDLCTLPYRGHGSRDIYVRLSCGGGRFPVPASRDPPRC